MVRYVIFKQNETILENLNGLWSENMTRSNVDQTLGITQQDRFSETLRSVRVKVRMISGRL